MPRVSKKNDAELVKKSTKKKPSTPKNSAQKNKAVKPSKSSSKSSSRSSAKLADGSLKKKARPVVIDIIEDEESDNFFPDFPELKTGTIAEDMFIDGVDADSKADKKNEAEKQSEGYHSVEEIDQQKKYFSRFISEKEEKNKKLELADDEYVEEGEIVKKSVGLYRSLVWKFVGLTAVLILIVWYFSFSKLVINIIPNGETLNDSLLVKIGPERVLGESASSTVSDSSEIDFRDVIDGEVREMEVSEEKVFSASGEESVGEEVYGKVTLINNSAKSQALVATTRLLSPDNKLFRIKTAVTIPAYGEIEAEIYADKPSSDLAIAPTTFTIPGLWLGLQDKIFAKSTTEFVYRQKIKKYVKASDIDNATKEMNDILLNKVKVSQSEDINTGVIYEALSPVSIESSAKIGDSVDEFTIKAKEKIAVISYSKKQAAELAKNKLSLLVPDDKELVGYDEKNIAYISDGYNSKTGVASIKVNFNGTMILKSNTEIIDKKQIVNLNRDQLENYLKTFPEIKTFELKFYPSFITRAPRLPERISVVID